MYVSDLKWGSYFANFFFTLFIDYGYNFVLVLKNLPYSFLMVKYPMTHFPIRHDGCVSCLQDFSVINYAAVDIPYTYSYMLVRVFLKRLIERRLVSQCRCMSGSYWWS